MLSQHGIPIQRCIDVPNNGSCSVSWVAKAAKPWQAGPDSLEIWNLDHVATTNATQSLMAPWHLGAQHRQASSSDFCDRTRASSAGPSSMPSPLVDCPTVGSLPATGTTHNRDPHHLLYFRSCTPVFHTKYGNFTWVKPADMSLQRSSQTCAHRLMCHLGCPKHNPPSIITWAGNTVPIQPPSELF